MNDTILFIDKIIDNLKLVKYVTVIANADTILQYMIELIIDNGANIRYLQYDSCNYDKEYLLTVSVESNELTFSIEKAYNYKNNIYVACPGGILYIHKDVPDKAIYDIVNNPFSGNLKIQRFIDEYEAEELNGCEDCPDRFECPESPYFNDECCCDCCNCCDEDEDKDDEDEDEDVTIASQGNGESINVVRNSDGTLRGFTKFYSEDNDGISTSHSHSFFSDNVDAIINAAKAIGVKL